MAERRMFAKTIIDSDAFLDMPLSAQALYFHLSMRADDDGFINNPKKIQRMIGGTDDDLKLLIAKSFLLPFESGVVVIKHWKIHNYIRSDRYTETVYIDEKSQLKIEDNGAYCVTFAQEDTGCLPPCIPDVYHMADNRDTQDRLGKDRLGKDRLGKDEGEPAADEPPPTHRQNVPYVEIQKAYNQLCPSLPTCKILSDARKKAIKARFTAGYTEDDFTALFIKAEASAFLKGANGRDWRADFDWLIRDTNMAKVLDGKYNDRQKNGTTNKSSNPFLDMLEAEGGSET